jgi:hypothetical protein
MRDRNDALDAARDTLMHIAAACGVAAKRLRHGLSLEVDLGLDDTEFALLAERQCGLGDRLRSDGKTTRIDGDELRDLLVWEVLQLTLARATGRQYGREALADAIAQAQAELRGGYRR